MFWPHLSVAYSDTRIEEPSLEQVIGLFAKLGECMGGDLFISGTPGDRELGLSGGSSRYLVSCSGECYGAYNLVDPSAVGDDWIILIVGGVPSAVEVNLTVEAGLAKQAIPYFFSQGDIDPQLRWL